MTAVHGSAVISGCGRYRYSLERCWADGPTVAFVMLNPSTADAYQDDATLRRITAFARAWNYGALIVGNLYAYRATDPADLWKTPDPVGPDNNQHLVRIVKQSNRIIAAWGAHARPDRIAEVLALAGMNGLEALALTKDGQPRHPLRLPGNLTPQPWNPTR